MMSEKKKQLTKAETQVMNILWALPEQQGFIQDIINQYPEPKPAYTTILTFMKILTDKGFVKPEKVGKANRFSPLVSKEDYTYSYIADVKDTFFRWVVCLAGQFLRAERTIRRRRDGRTEATDEND